MQKKMLNPKKKINTQFAEFLFNEEQTLLAKQRTSLSFTRTGLAFVGAGVAIVTLVSLFYLRILGGILILIGFHQIYEGHLHNQKYEDRLENLKELIHQYGLDYYEHYKDRKLSKMEK